MASSSECSTDLAASASADSAPELSAEQYDDDEFDDYSDSFESDSDAAGPEASGPAAVSSVADRAPLKAGDRVQVFWPEENEWFDGEIRRGEEGNEPRYFVHYDDGEQQWEGPANIRPVPATIAGAADCEQMQLLVPLGEVGARATIGRRARVYWPDEGEWYNGVVSAAQASPAALKIAYDDGDSRWEHEHALKWILLLQAANEAPVSLRTLTGNSEVIVTSAPPSPPGQVLYARPYKQVVSDHFEPVRIARPYRCAVEKHSESVIFPRRPYRERRYLHVVHESLECFRYSQHATAPSSLQLDKADCTAQASLPSFLPELSS